MLVSNRDEIRAERKAYIDAMIRNDPGAVEGVARNFEKRYGFKMPVSQRDIQDAQIRRSIPRLATVIQTLPPGPLREQYVQLVASAFGAGGAAFLGMEPGELGKPGASKAAAKARVQVRPTGTQFNAFTGVVPGELSRQPTDVDRLGPF